MIIACPACATRYVVPDSAIGVDGRTVRCAKCRHSWFQDGPVLERPAPPPPPPPAPPPPAEVDEAPFTQPSAEAPAVAQRVTDFDPRPSPVEPVAEDVAAPAFPEPDAEPQPQPEPHSEPWSDPQPASPPAEVPGFAETARNRVDVVYQDSPSSFAHEPPFRARRNPAKMWTAAAVAFALLVAALIGAVAVWGLPGWVPIARPTFGAAEPDLVLEFPPERQDRRTLPNGTEFFGASGTVTNVGQATRRVPSILIVLRDGRDRIVYTWEVRAPKPALAPGESVTINEAVTDVPRSVKVAEIGWKP